jgi:hypothetical protein
MLLTSNVGQPPTENTGDCGNQKYREKSDQQVALPHSVGKPILEPYSASLSLVLSEPYRASAQMCPGRGDGQDSNQEEKRGRKTVV